MVSLIGPNGAGKTTFFNMLSGLYEPSAGTLVYLGKDITKYGAHKRAQMGIGRTFRNIRLFGTMSATENVLAGMHTRLRGSILGSIFRMRELGARSGRPSRGPQSCSTSSASASGRRRALQYSSGACGRSGG
jgi:ABC-type branched-subunit amino acid transport system ATPase component